LSAYPDYGLVRKRADFDELLVRQAEKAGARLYDRCNVSGPVLDDRTGRTVGVTARLGQDKRPVPLRAPLVVAADGNSTRPSLALGPHRRQDRPTGAPYPPYFHSPRHHHHYLQPSLELCDNRDRQKHPLPGSGRLFAMGAGTSTVRLRTLT
ncbi:NAD(P)/FAD-dependent oxidoreductase, partial [Saccharothrix sp. ST-888]|uniref:NAD(P)/FAD-dependent oxidoreductase n=1 Tax=Saccharothrix sp. ST-888 TaxID=1427391 RepID=UPI0005EC8FFD